MQGRSPFTYTIQAGDTFHGVALRYNSNADVIQALNPGVGPTTLQIGQVINVPRPADAVGANNNSSDLQSPIINLVGGNSAGAAYVHYSGPSSAFPDPTRWALYGDLWAKNRDLMGHHNNPNEIRLVGEAILSTAQESGVDARAILCLIMQESGGNVRVGNTASWQGIVNTGIMQAHNGASFNPGDPEGSIRQMVRDGTLGTASGDGLKQCLEHRGWNYYLAFREYNSGGLGVNAGELGDGMGATGPYVEKMANRLMGHVWGNM